MITIWGGEPASFEGRVRLVRKPSLSSMSIMASKVNFSILPFASSDRRCTRAEVNLRTERSPSGFFSFVGVASSTPLLYS